MSICNVILLISLIFSSLQTAGAQVSKVGFEKKGEALIEVTIFKIDVYLATYYENMSSKERLLELKYLMDVERKLSLKGWSEGFLPLDKKKYSSAINWIEKNTFDLKKGQIFSIVITDAITKFYKNGKLQSETKDPLVAEIAHFPWIGDKPLDKDIKRKLLGTN